MAPTDPEGADPAGAKVRGFGSRLASQSAVYSLGNMLSKLVAVFLVPIYTRVLSPGDYGIVSVSGVLYSFMNVLLNMGASSALFRYYHAAEDDTGRKGYVTAALSLLVGTGAILAAAVFLAARPLAMLLFEDPAQAAVVRTVAAWSFAGMFSIVPLAVFRAEGKAPYYVALTLGTFLANVGFTILMVVVLRRGPLGSIQANVMAMALAAMVVAPMMLSRLTLPPSGTRMREIVSFGLPLMPFGLGMLVLNMGDRVILTRLAGASETGLYSLGYTAGMLVNLFAVQPFQTAWWPLVFATHEEEGAKERFSRVLTYFLFVALLMALGAGILAKEAIRLIAAPPFWPAWSVSFWVALAYVMYGAFYCVSVGSLLKGKSRAFTPLAIVGAAVAFAAYWLLIPPFGRMGAAWATLASFSAMAVVGYLVAQRAYPIRYEWVRIAKLVVVTAAVYAVLAPTSVDPVWLGFIVKGVLTIVAYLGGLWVLRFFRPGEYRAAADLVGRAYLRARLPRREADAVDEAGESLETAERM